MVIAELAILQGHIFAKEIWPPCFGGQAGGRGEPAYFICAGVGYLRHFYTAAFMEIFINRSFRKKNVAASGLFLRPWLRIYHD